MPKNKPKFVIAPIPTPAPPTPPIAAPDEKVIADSLDPNSHGIGTLKINRDGYVEQVPLAYLPEGLAYFAFSADTTPEKERA